MTIDPTVLAILSIFGGAALTALAGLIGAGINASREHNRWLREQRISAYERAHGLLEEMRYHTQDERDVERFRKELDALADERGLSKEDRAKLVEKGLRAFNGKRFTPEASYAWSREILARKIEIQASIALLGTRDVDARFDAAFGPLTDQDREGYKRAMLDLELAMRKALKVKD